ncbi:ERMES complex subunit [Entophlyctis luteolus]|nr:ERMES complex subunit [Entophlyctis luteolus]
MFKINWPRFSEEFIAQASQQLTVALNKGQKPNNIVGTIDVADLNMGTKERNLACPPDLEILEIGELGEDRFKGIFKMTYAGDATLTLITKVQANPLNLPRHTYSISLRQPILAANHPLVVPMRLRISNLKLRGIIVLVIDKVKGTTLVFKNDPLEKVDVNSTFDGVASVRRFLQQQIEGQLRQMFQEDLPMLIHKLSLVLIEQQQKQRILHHSYDDDYSLEMPANEGFDSQEKYNANSEQLPLQEAQLSQMSDETVHQFVSRPHHQKWSGNEPVTMLDSESDADHLESIAIGAVVLQKSLVPNFGPFGLEEVLQESKASQESNSALAEGGRSFIKSPSISKHTFDENREAVAKKSAKITYKVRKPLQNSAISEGRSSIESISQKMSPVLSDAKSLGAEGASKSNRISAPSMKTPSSKSTVYASSVYSPTIIHRSSVSLKNESVNGRNDSPSSTPSLASERLKNSGYVGQTSRQRYAPAPHSFNGHLSPNSQNNQHHYLHHHHHHHQNNSGLKSGPSSESGYGAGSFQKSGDKPKDISHKDTVHVIKDRVILKQGDNQVTAHLASLMLAHHTISPVTHRVEHATFRSGSIFSAASSSSANLAAMTTPSSVNLAALNASPVTDATVGADATAKTISENAGDQTTSTQDLRSASPYPATPVMVAPKSPSLAAVGVTGSGLGQVGGSSSATRKRGARNVRKLNLPAGIAVPAIPRNGSAASGGGGSSSSSNGGLLGSGLLGRPGSAGGRSFSSFSSLSSSAIGDQNSDASAESNKPETFDQMRGILAMNSTDSKGRRVSGGGTGMALSSTVIDRIDESNESGDDVAGLLADRLELQMHRGVNRLNILNSIANSPRSSISPRNLTAVSNSKDMADSSLTDDELQKDVAVADARSPLSTSGFVSKIGLLGSLSSSHDTGPISPDAHPYQALPPRSASSMSARSGGSVTGITVKRVVRVKSNASSMTITPASLNIIPSPTTAMSPRD